MGQLASVISKCSLLVELLNRKTRYFIQFKQNEELEKEYDVEYCTKRGPKRKEATGYIKNKLQMKEGSGNVARTCQINFFKLNLEFSIFYNFKVEEV